MKMIFTGLEVGRLIAGFLKCPIKKIKLLNTDFEHDQLMIEVEIEEGK